MSESKRKLSPAELLAEIDAHALDALLANRYGLAGALARSAEALAEWIADQALENRLRAAGRDLPRSERPLSDPPSNLGHWFDPSRLRSVPLIGRTRDEQPSPSESLRAQLLEDYPAERIAAEHAQGLYTVADGPCICRGEPDACWHVHPADRKPRRGGEVDMRPRPADLAAVVAEDLDAGVTARIARPVFGPPDLACGACGPNSISFSTPQALATHIRSDHGVAEYAPGSPDLQDAPTQVGGVLRCQCGELCEGVEALAEHTMTEHGNGVR